MSSLAFVTHPSVRIKGTENSYTPSQCLDERCPVKAPHLHCPFCVKTDAYQDPVILKAHYRVKHVDKGIEFAGLKILRCCDQCDIIGIIKGEKRFKGAHWHCYRCRNGFNRRDEAIKHYKTHFRNPQTTFQIQITQDLNSQPEVRAHEEHSASQDAFVSIENSVQEIIQPSLSQTGIATSEQNVITAGTISTRRNGGMKKIKVRHELLGKVEPGDHEDEETIMIIQGDQIESAFANHIINSGELTVLNRTVDPNLSWEIRFRLEEEEKNIYKAKAEEYKAQVDILEQQVADLESQLAQQSQLKLHELTDILNSGDVSKQRLGQQLIKFLEHCQLQAHGSIAVIEDDSHMSVKQHEHLKSDDGIIHGLEHNPNSLSGSDSQQLEIPNGYQVVCTTSEGHVVVTHAPDSIVASSMSEGEAVIVPGECLDSSIAAISNSISESSEEVLFSHVISSQIKEEPTNSSVLPQAEHDGLADEQEELAGDQEGLADVTVDHMDLAEVAGDHGDLAEVSSVHCNLTEVAGEQNCLMEVVAAADELVQLDDAVASSTISEDQEIKPTFVMDVEDNGVQHAFTPAEENCNSREEEVSVGVVKVVNQGPPAKRVKIS